MAAAAGRCVAAAAPTNPRPSGVPSGTRPRIAASYACWLQRVGKSSSREVVSNSLYDLHVGCDGGFVGRVVTVSRQQREL